MPRREDSLQSNLGPFRLPERTKPLEMRIIPNYIKLYLTSALSLPRSSAAQGSFLVKASKLLSHRQFPSNFLLLAVCHTCLNPSAATTCCIVVSKSERKVLRSFQMRRYRK